jgi:hypothetical protein
MADQYYGKYSGVVVDNGRGQGLLDVEVPTVFVGTLTARPALPYGVFFLPENKSGVWVEFEGGDSRLPLWTGIHHGPGEWAQDRPAVRTVRTKSGHQLVFDDADGAVVITHGSGKHVVRLDGDGVTIKHGTAPNEVTVAASAITAKTAAATLELAGGVIKLNGGTMPVVRAATDKGLGNLGAPVLMATGNPTVLA